jgi:putative ABC transport system permease protein
MSFGIDVRHAFRRIHRRPAQAIVSVVTLAIGLAVSATLFTVTRDVVFHPFPFRDPGRLTAIWSSDVPRGIPRLELTYFQFDQLRKRAKSFDGVALMSAANFNVIVNTPEPHQVIANFATESFPRVTGMTAALGRTFSSGDFRPNAPGAILISDRLWRSLFGARRDAVGRVVNVEGQPTTIAGVLPANFNLPQDADLIYPSGPPTSDDQLHNFVCEGIGHLRPGVSLETANAELRTIAASLHSANKGYETVSIYALPLTDEILGATRPAVTVLFAMSLLVLAIATLNVSSIFVANVVARQRELAIRSALGAGRHRLVRALLVESFVIASIAAAGGYLLARLALAVFLRMAPETMPRIGDVAIRTGTYGFLAAAAIVVSVVSAFVASLRIGQTRSVREAVAKTGSAAASRRLLSALTAIEIAVALTLLAGGALMIRSFLSIAAIDPGFRAANVLTAQVPLPSSIYDKPEKGIAFFRQLLPRLRSAPGVVEAGAILVRPLELELGWDYNYTLVGQGPAEQDRNPLANLLSCSPGYFEAIGTPLLRGRTFTDRDDANAPPVIVVSRSFARRFWNTDDVIGKTVKAGRPNGKGKWRTIVGVVSDVRFRGLTTEKLDIYEPHTQSSWTPQYVVIRTTGPPRTVESTLCGIVASIDRGVPVASVRTTTELIDAKLAQPRVNAWVVGTFAAVALLLSLIGVYAVLSYVVRSRTQEVGVRMALGAQPLAVLRMILREAASLAIIGAVAGAFGAVAVSRALGRFLYGIEGATLPIVAGCAAFLIVSSIVAALIPGWRASRVDPSISLRSE